MENTNYTLFQKDNDRTITLVVIDINNLDGISEEYKKMAEYQKYVDNNLDNFLSFNNWKKLLMKLKLIQKK